MTTISPLSERPPPFADEEVIPDRLHGGSLFQPCLFEWKTFENDYPDIAAPIKANLDKITARLDAMCRVFVRR